MLKKAIAILVLVASTTATLRSTALAAEPTDRSAPPKDVGIGAMQVVAGTGMAVASLVLASQALEEKDHFGLFVGGLALGSAATGLTVCAIGLASTESEGGCGGAILGSEIGSLAALPGAVLGGVAFSGDDDPYASVGGAMLGFIGGYVIGTVTGATIGWHAAKRPRAGARPALARTAPPAAPSPPAAAWPELKPRTWTGAGVKDGGLKLTVPIVAMTF
jgi:hypothetical protein